MLNIYYIIHTDIFILLGLGEVEGVWTVSAGDKESPSICSIIFALRFCIAYCWDLERFNDSISAMMACKASIKAGDPISMEEMKTLIERLKKCENPFNCAHGRPTIIHYPKYELDKLFKRAV